MLFLRPTLSAYELGYDCGASGLRIGTITAALGRSKTAVRLKQYEQQSVQVENGVSPIQAVALQCRMSALSRD